MVKDSEKKGPGPLFSLDFIDVPEFSIGFYRFSVIFHWFLKAFEEKCFFKLFLTISLKNVFRFRQMLFWSEPLWLYGFTGGEIIKLRPTWF